MELLIKNTIAAAATPAGAGAISVVRLSGTTAVKIACEMLYAFDGEFIKANSLVDRNMKLCEFKSGKIRDRVLAVAFYSPNSYTGEEVVEIQCHGNAALAGTIVNEAIRLGARAAENGEFTRRAFLNGKIDLTGAEGIIDLINAEGEAALAAAAESAEGGLFKKIDAVYNILIGLAAEAESSIDYPEEDLEEVTNAKILLELKKVSKSISELADGYAGGTLIKDGVTVAIVGKPNVGKSTLLNGLLGYERAIVSPEAGTTRDTVSESYLYKGIRFNLIDTAGIREEAGEVERLGIQRSYSAIKRAEAVLALSEADGEFNIELPKSAKVIKISTKSDLARGEGFCVSAVTGENIEELKQLLYLEVEGKISGGGARLNNERQYTAVLQAGESVARAIGSIGKISIDCIASDIKAAAESLGKVTGRCAGLEVINEIFKRFCVGK